MRKKLPEGKVTIIMQANFTYFVWKKPSQPASYRVVHREVKLRTRQGYPICYSLKALPEEFETWEKAQSIADQINRGEMPENTLLWSDEVEEAVD